MMHLSEGHDMHYAPTIPWQPLSKVWQYVRVCTYIITYGGRELRSLEC